MGITRFKVGVQHAETNIINQGAGSAPGQMNVLETQGGARPLGGAETTIKSSATTGEVCNVGDIVKYVNLFIQVAARPAVATPNDRAGWVEWGFVMVKESDAAATATNLGTLTLGTTLTNRFRNECIYTGAIPVGLDVPNYQAITIKVPKFKQKIRLGDEWRFISSVRSNNAAATDSDGIRVVKSCMYKSYS